jgi:hypothetical protein
MSVKYCHTHISAIKQSDGINLKKGLSNLNHLIFQSQMLFL